MAVVGGVGAVVGMWEELGRGLLARRLGRGRREGMVSMCGLAAYQDSSAGLNSPEGGNWGASMEGTRRGCAGSGSRADSVVTGHDELGIEVGRVVVCRRRRRRCRRRLWPATKVRYRVQQIGFAAVTAASSNCAFESRW